MALTFLEMNHVAIEFEERQFEEFVVRVATGQAEKEEISRFFENCMET